MECICSLTSTRRPATEAAGCAARVMLHDNKHNNTGPPRASCNFMRVGRGDGVGSVGGARSSRNNMK